MRFISKKKIKGLNCPLRIKEGTALNQLLEKVIDKCFLSKFE